MAETAPPPDSRLLEEQFMYDTYYDAYGEPVTANKAVENIAQYAEEGTHYSNHIAQRSEDPDRNTYARIAADRRVQSIRDEAVASPSRFADTLADPRRHSEQLYGRALSQDFINGTAASGVGYFNVLRERAERDGDPAAREALDPQVPVSQRAYRHPEKVPPGAEYDRSFDATLQNILQVVTDRSMAEPEQWNRVSTVAARQLREALRTHPDGIALLLRMRDEISRNARKSAALTDGAREDHAGVLAHKEHLTRAHRTGHISTETQNLLGIDTPEIIRRYVSSLKPEEVPATNAGIAAAARKTIGRLDPYGHQKKRAIDEWAMRMRFAEESAAQYTAHYQLAADSILDGNNGVRELQQYETQNELTRARFESILNQLPNANESNSPEAFESRYGDPAIAYSHAMDAALNWHYTGNPDDEHAVFTALRPLERYLSEIDSAIGLEGDSIHPRHPWYGKLIAQRARVQSLYNTATHHKKIVQIEHTRDGRGGQNFAGRYAAHYVAGRGIKLDDGSGVTLYPDGSYSLPGHGGDEVRRFADGHEWHPMPPTTPVPKVQIPAGLPRVIERRQSESFQSWFRDQGNLSAERRAQAYAAALAEYRLAQAEADPANTDARMHGNVLTYWANYLNVPMGVESRDKAVLQDGTVAVNNATYYGLEAQWLIGPDGSMSAYRKQADGSSRHIRSYSPDGTPL